MISTYLLLIVALTACQPAESTPLNPEDLEAQTMTPGSSPESIPESTQAQPSNPLLTPEATDMAPAITPDAAAQKMVDLAKEHLAQRLSIAVDQIALVELRPALWRDASLGCPKPAVDYIPMEIPGYNILLEAGGQTYNYHTDAVNRFVLCNRQ